MAEESPGNEKTHKANGCFKLESPGFSGEFLDEQVILWHRAWGEERSFIEEKRNDKFQVGCEASIEFEGKFIYSSEKRNLHMNKIGIEHVEREEKRKLDGDFLAKNLLEFALEN
ncbi:hypothetical protein AMTR_s00056p00028730 [Amborella trichopoda]|uniref:Uncharacterized protein n=1 Tax=Amborella trichopoda TaxID=13333 RepID=U5CY38_AMBTC|nr:hypothetical protein AMTR_s00056p00028730 [Amborella trichopoda]